MNKRLVIFLLSGCLFFGCAPNVPAVIPDPPVVICECQSTPVASDKYAYPAPRGSAAWNAASAIGIYDTLYKLSQIPASQLTAMSTLGIIQSLEENPMIVDMSVFNFIVGGRNSVLGRLNVNQELIKRSDAGTVILNYYKKKYPCCIDAISDSFKKGDYAIRNWWLFEIICTQDAIVNNLTSDEKKEFAKTIILKGEEKLKYSILATVPGGEEGSILLLSCLMKAAAYAPYLTALSNDPDMANLLVSGRAPKATLDKLLQLGKQFAGI